MSSAVLVLNCGSSSVKFALINPDTGEQNFSGLAERVGSPDVSVRFDIRDERVVVNKLTDRSHKGVVAEIMRRVVAFTEAENLEITAVGHRVVHGGDEFSESVVINDHIMETVRRCVPLAPLHNPANITGIEAVTAVMPDITQVAVFDTAFHQTMPEKAFRYAVPNNWYTDHGVRRYGFHGTSHQYVSERVAELDGRPLKDLRIITAHLGNGCSMAAIKGGECVDTSMGLTPLEGLVMGTRSGDIDPGVLAYIEKAAGYTGEEVNNALNKKSGLLGLSGVSNDMRTVEQAAADGDASAKLALEVFKYRVAKYIGSYVPALGGLDLLVFTGGIGENSDITREDIIGYLGYLGLEVDPELNDGLRGKEAKITTDGPVAAWVVPTNEELMIARDAHRLAV